MIGIYPGHYHGPQIEANQYSFEDVHVANPGTSLIATKINEGGKPNVAFVRHNINGIVTSSGQFIPKVNGDKYAALICVIALQTILKGDELKIFYGSNHSLAISEINQTCSEEDSSLWNSGTIEGSLILMTRPVRFEKMILDRQLSIKEFLHKLLSPEYLDIFIANSGNLSNFFINQYTGMSRGYYQNSDYRELCKKWLEQMSFKQFYMLNESIHLLLDAQQCESFVKTYESISSRKAIRASDFTSFSDLARFVLLTQSVISHDNQLLKNIIKHQDFNTFLEETIHYVRQLPGYDSGTKEIEKQMISLLKEPRNNKEKRSVNCFKNMCFQLEIFEF